MGYSGLALTRWAKTFVPVLIERWGRKGWCGQVHKDILEVILGMGLERYRILMWGGETTFR